MRKLFMISFMLFMSIALLPLIGCKNGANAPSELLNSYFGAAEKQNYGQVYDCYYAAYKSKVNRAEYIKRRKEDPSVLKNYKILSVEQKGREAKAQVLLAFAPAGHVKANPVDIKVAENMINENGAWKIKVW
ncbi:MAG: hypothetical protein M0Z61_14545 [Nitrospiraceae bacterium]|nr:hypothetical protein [Nitrospiraceae bacterium]